MKSNFFKNKPKNVEDTIDVSDGSNFFNNNSFVESEHLTTDFSERQSEKVKTYSPSKYNEIELSALALKVDKKIILNLTKTDSKEKNRILNFFSGIIFALNGEIDSLEKDIYEFKVK